MKLNKKDKFSKKFVDFCKKNKEKLINLRDFFIFILSYGFILNYSFWALFGFLFKYFTFPAYGILFYFIKEELVRIIREIRK
jgi:hypothetical protein